MEYIIKPHWNEQHAIAGVLHIWFGTEDQRELKGAVNPIGNGYELLRGWRAPVLVSDIDQAIEVIKETGGIS